MEAGGPYSAAIQDYCRYANTKKLVPGVTFNCVIKDDQYDPNKTVVNFDDYKKLKGNAYLAYGTGGTLAIKSRIQSEKIAVIPASMHIGLIEGPNSDYIFLETSTYSEQIVNLIEYIAKREKGAKLALLISPSAFGRAPLNDAKEAAKRLGLTLVSTHEIAEDQKDVAATLQKLKAAGVGYIIHQNNAAAVALVLKEGDKIGLGAEFHHMGTHFAGGDDLTRLASKSAFGFVWATSFYLPDEIDRPGVRLANELSTINKRSFETSRSVHYLAGMMATSIMVEAMRRAKGDISRQAIVNQLNAMNGANAYDPGFTVGPVNFSLKDRVGTENIRLLMVFANGNFRPLTGPHRSLLFKQIHPN